MSPWLIHPGLALAGLAAGAIPVLIHLINRRRHRRVRWAAMDFLLAARAKSVRRLRLENWALLALRVAVVVVLALALSRPLLSANAALGGGGGHHRILVVDNSFSASAAPDGTSTQPPAVTAALELLSELPESDAISVITASAPVERVVGHAAYERRSVRERLQSISATQRATDWPAAFAVAAELLSESPAAPGNRAVYAISDHVAADWSEKQAAGSAARRLAEEATLVLVRTATGERPNAAILHLQPADSLITPQRPTQLTVRVANFGPGSIAPADLQVLLSDRLIRTVDLDALPAGQEVEKTFSIQLSAGGDHALEVRLQSGAQDTFPADNARYMVLRASERVPVLVVDGQPAARRFGGQAGYLAAALSPYANGGGLFAPTVIADLELPGQVLDSYRLIVLCSVPRLDERMWSRLADRVEAGDGLLLFLGEPVDRENYNRFGFANGKGVLPGTLQPPAGDAQSRQSFLRLQPAGQTHPAVRALVRSQDSGLFASGRIYRYVPLGHDEAQANTLLNYTNGDPAILEKPFGRGHCIVVNTTANMEWNNLAARGDYVSMVWSLSEYLAAGPQRAEGLRVGERITEEVSAAAVHQTVEVNGPEGQPRDVRIQSVEGRFGFQSQPLEPAGHYRMTVGRTTSLAAVNIDPKESSPAVLTEDELRAVAGPEAIVRNANTASAVAERGSSEVAGMLLYLVVLLLVLETYLAMRFARRR